MPISEFNAKNFANDFEALKKVVLEIISEINRLENDLKNIQQQINSLSC